MRIIHIIRRHRIAFRKASKGWFVGFEEGRFRVTFVRLCFSLFTCMDLPPFLRKLAILVVQLLTRYIQTRDAPSKAYLFTSSEAFLLGRCRVTLSKHYLDQSLIVSLSALPPPSFPAHQTSPLCLLSDSPAMPCQSS